MKTSVAAAASFFLLGILGQSSITTTTAQRADLPPQPLLRYRAFSLLSDIERTAVTDQLGYNSSETWNVPGTDIVEDFWYGGLTPTQQAGAVVAMGIGGDPNALDDAESVWDCWINHYDSYSWTEMVTEGVAQYWTALGWTQAVWENGGTSPPSNGLAWANLTAAEQLAATNLCYTEQLWDGVDLQELVTATPTAAPSTAAPTGEDFTRPPTTAPTAPLPTLSPTDTPTLAPTTTFVSPPSPPVRYTAFDELPAPLQSILNDTLGYTEETWNIPGTAEVESDVFVYLDPAIQTVITTASPNGLGMTADVWDCHVNHYGGYSWFELNTEAGVQQYWAAMGWTAASWAGVADEPATEEAFWADLTEDQQAAAEMLCYFQELWDGLNLTQTELDPFTAAPTIAPTPEDGTREQPPSAASRMIVSYENIAAVLAISLWLANLAFF